MSPRPTLRRMATNVPPASGSEPRYAMCNNPTASPGCNSLAARPTSVGESAYRLPILSIPEIGHPRGEDTPDERWSCQAPPLVDGPPRCVPLKSEPELRDAMSGVMKSSVIWYEAAGRPTLVEELPQGIFPASVTKFDHSGSETQAAAHCSYKLLADIPDAFENEPCISFKGADGEFSPIKDMCSKGFAKDGLLDPWTNNSHISEKFVLQVQVQDADPERGLEARSAHVKYIYWRTNCQNPHPITKAELGYKISNALRVSKEFEAYCEKKRLTLDDLALFDLVKISKGKWQVTLCSNVTALASASTSA